MKTIITTALLISLAFSGHAQQVCLTEAQIPSSTPDSRFVDNGNGTISDSGTGLMWQKCSLGLSGNNCDSGSITSHNWQQALAAAQSNNLAGHNDWRLPNLKELYSIVERRCYNPAINSSYFPNTASSNYWSASPYSGGHFASGAWDVDFRSGDSHAYNRSYDWHVRLVRFGQ